MNSEIWSVEGNIGSGKSTLIKMLKEINNNKNIIFIPEPVDEWSKIKDKNGKTILERFYENQDKWSFSFQMMAYISRLSQLKKFIRENPNSILITERCTYTDRYVFAQMLHDDGKINSIDMQIYLMWFDEFMKEIPIKGFIYVKTSSKKCLERVKKRGRIGENIPLEYLKKCDFYHQNWLINAKNILCLDGDEEYDSKGVLIQKWKAKILNHIKSKNNHKKVLWREISYC
jgi:deoxyadenosine/deoxycytidine kinase